MFENASCNLLLFSLLGRNILLLSDCDDRNPQVYQWFIQPKKAVIYHVSAESIDKMKVRSVSRQGLAGFGADYPGAVMADRPFFPVELT